MSVRSLLSAGLCLLLPWMAAAQIGINGGIRFHDAPKWDIVALSNNSVTDVPGTGWSAGIDYALRMRNTRIEILPELNYATTQADAFDLGSLDGHFFSGFLNIHTYILDMKGDCDCPTFYKSGNTLKKGLFLQISPGYTLFYGYINTDQVQYRGRSTNISIAGGAGIDFGISKRLTITPFAGVRYFPNAIWPGIEEAITRDISLGDRSASNNGPLTQIYASVRVGFGKK